MTPRPLAPETKGKFVFYGLLVFCGLGSLCAYLYAWSLGDLRSHIPEFLLAFFAAFAFYAVATILVLRMGVQRSRGVIALIFGLALLFNLVLVFTPPSLSDDMYRYVWDGRVQAEGISPYRYPANARDLIFLRDPHIWRSINRKPAVTVYPPAAEIAYALLWRVFPDSVRGFQVFMAAMGLLAGGLLVGLLRDLERSTLRVLIFLWAPLLIFEAAHSAHVDTLVLPLIIGAWWARLREKDGLTGLLLGIAAAIKLYPALLLPALWRPNHPQGRWRMPLAFAGAVLTLSLPYIIAGGAEIFTFLPTYLGEYFNIAPPLLWLLRKLPHETWAESQGLLQMGMLVLLVIWGLVTVLRPAQDGETALRRCLWPISIYTLLNPNLHPWYLLWLLPLLAVFLESGSLKWRGHIRPFGLRLDFWTAWWIFSGLVALSYSFFQNWEDVPAAINVQYGVLYLFLGLALFQYARKRYLFYKGVQPSAGASAGTDS